jgi:hypothetical protein
MRLAVEVTEREVDQLCIEATVIAETADEYCACLRHASAHRPCKLAVLSSDYPAWQQAQKQDDIGAAKDLLQDVTLLWDRSLVWSECDMAFHWNETLHKSVIALQLIERLRWAEQLDEALITLEQLLLEKELGEQLNNCLPAGPAAPRGSAADKRHTL